jgi:predicted DNA-binding protein (UPF0251 family)/predicted Fe-Mo cluster-binding NifX family protein
MPRPRKCRRVGVLPGITYYKPRGIPLRYLKETRVSVEEAEALRLKDLEGLDQSAAAERMGVSRATFQRVLKTARRHVAEALLGGRAIRIEGGYFTVGSGGNETEGTMKIAVVTDDGKTICGHYGRATGYAVFSVENGAVTGKELREKAGHHTFAGHGSEPGDPSGRHGFGAGAQDRHASMTANITDCQVVLSGGMGWGAFENLKSQGIEAIITDVADIEAAVQQYLAGDLPNLMERLH